MESRYKYTVVIGDIRGSKQLSGMDRYQTQLFIKSAIVQINEQFAHCMEAPMTITKGDEFQGLVDTPENAYRIITTLQKMIFPTQIRYGFGVGKIYRMGSVLPIEMDGPAFHRANSAIVHAKKKKSTLWFTSENDLLDKSINTSFLLISAIKSRWSERHYRLYWNYLELGTYREVAALENVTPQAICDVLKNTRATEVIHAEKNLAEIFHSLSEQLEADYQAALR